MVVSRSAEHQFIWTIESRLALPIHPNQSPIPYRVETTFLIERDREETPIYIYLYRYGFSTPTPELNTLSNTLPHTKRMISHTNDWYDTNLNE